MEVGAKVTAEVLVQGKPEKIHGTVLSRYNDGGTMYEIRPDGFDTLVLNVPERNVIARKPEGTVQPHLNYNKKKQ